MKRGAALVVGLVVVLVAGYWYWSPYLAMRSLRAAAQAGDGDRVAQYVDFEKVRSSLKEQFRQRATDAVGQRMGEGAGAAAGATLGALLGTALVDRAVDALVTPQALRQMLARGQRASASSDTGEARARWAHERVSTDVIIAFPKEQADLSPAARDRFVFSRSGFADWKLTEIRFSGSN